MRNLKDIILERLVLSKNKSNQVITFEDVNYPTELEQGGEFQMTCIAKSTLYPIETMQVDFINVNCLTPEG